MPIVKLSNLIYFYLDLKSSSPSPPRVRFMQYYAILTLNYFFSLRHGGHGGYGGYGGYGGHGGHGGHGGYGGYGGYGGGHYH